MSNDTIQKNGLLKNIHFMSNMDELWQVEHNGEKGQLHYLFGNAIASYSLYNSHYQITKYSEKLLCEDYNLDLSEVYTRSKIHGIRDNKRKKIFTFEHMVPVKVQKTLIKNVVEQNGKITMEELKTILDACGKVVIMTQVENKQLEKEYRSTLPENCDPFINPEARYTVCNIELSDTLVSVHGAMMR